MCLSHAGISRAVTVFKTETETVVFSQNRRELKPAVFLVPDERLCKSGQQARFTVAT